jgi:hypothetical protein
MLAKKQETVRAVKRANLAFAVKERNSIIVGHPAGFGVRELAPAFDSGGNYARRIITRVQSAFSPATRPRPRIIFKKPSPPTERTSLNTPARRRS